MKTKVLFQSTHNACRSQIAEGLVNHYLGDRVSAFSAGTEPTSINHRILAVMSEIGIDVSSQDAKLVDEFEDESFDYVITLLEKVADKCDVHGAISYCGRCGKDCPHLEQTSHGGGRLYLLGFPDPSQANGDEEQVMAAFRKTRDAIKTELLQLFEETWPMPSIRPR